MSTTALDFMRAIRDADDASLAKSIAWALVLRANEKWLAWPDYDTLAHDIGSSRATVARTMPPILAAGGVGRVRITMTRQRNGRRWGPTVYQLSLSTSQDEHLRMSISPSDAHHEHLKTGPIKVSKPAPSRSQDETVSAQLTAQGTAQGSIPGLSTEDEPPKGRALKGKPKAKSDSEPTSAHQRVVDCYFAEYEQARGEKPPFDSHDGKRVNALLDKLGGDAERACRCIRNAFADDFWRGQVTIRKIAEEPGRFDGNRQNKQSTKAPRGMTLQPSDGTSWLAKGEEHTARMMAAEETDDNG